MKGIHRSRLPVEPTRLMSMVLGAVAALCGAPCLVHAQVLPNGGHFVAASGSMSANGASLTINQNTSRGVIDWNSFSIGMGHRVAFENGGGAAKQRFDHGANEQSGKLRGMGFQRERPLGHCRQAPHIRCWRSR